jgi:peptidyl-dipeptidase Dcp
MQKQSRLHERVLPLTAFAKKLDGIERLQKMGWCILLGKELFNLDDEKLKPYFQLEKVLMALSL